MFDALQNSKTEFRDMEDVDEFDEAPAPTKNIQIAARILFYLFRACVG
jgi:hypothetical protein